MLPTDDNTNRTKLTWHPTWYPDRGVLRTEDGSYEIELGEDFTTAYVLFYNGLYLRCSLIEDNNIDIEVVYGPKVAINKISNVEWGIAVGKIWAVFDKEVPDFKELSELLDDGIALDIVSQQALMEFFMRELSSNFEEKPPRDLQLSATILQDRIDELRWEGVLTNTGELLNHLREAIVDGVIALDLEGKHFGAQNHALIKHLEDARALLKPR